MCFIANRVQRSRFKTRIRCAAIQATRPLVATHPNASPMVSLENRFVIQEMAQRPRFTRVIAAPFRVSASGIEILAEFKSADRAMI